jgi:hypothetical protein
MKYISKLPLVIIPVICCAANLSFANNKNDKVDKFYSYKPGDSESYHIYYPGDKVEHNGHVYKNVKIMNNSHLPDDSNMLGSYWKRADQIKQSPAPA